MTESCQFNVMNCHKILPTRNSSHKPASSQALLTRMSSGRFSNLSLRNKFPCTGTLNKSGFVKIDMTLGEIRDSDSSLGLTFLDEQILRTNLILLG